MHLVFSDRVPDYLVEFCGGNLGVARQFWTEYQRRVGRELADALSDQQRVDVENFKASHRPHDGLGQCKFRISRKLRNWIGKHFGWDAAVDDGFCAELIRDNGQHCFRPTLEKRAIITKPELRHEIVARPETVARVVPRPPAQLCVTPKGEPSMTPPA